MSVCDTINNNMKKAFRNFKFYLIAIGLAIFGIGLPLGIYGITLIPSLNASPFAYIYLLWIFMVLYILIGFVVSDITNVRYRRKSQNYDGELSEEQSEKAWSIRFPFYFAALIMFVVCMFFEIWFWVSGSYPLPF